MLSSPGKIFINLSILASNLLSVLNISLWCKYCEKKSLRPYLMSILRKGGGKMGGFRKFQNFDVGSQVDAENSKESSGAIAFQKFSIMKKL